MRSIARLVARRLLVAVPLLILVTLVVFALIHIAPGDPVRTLLGARPSSPETIAAIRERYNLNDPFIVQYGKWLLAALQGDLGTSIQGGRSVSTVIFDRLGLTLFLSAMSAFIVLFAGIGLGILSALKRGSWIDQLVVTLGILGVSAPAFVMGIALLYFFGVMLEWFPVYGAGKGFFDRFWHLVLPSLALAFSVMAIIIKITRAAVVEQLGKDYVTFARARGLSSRRIIVTYVLRNALVPVVTAAGLIVVGLVSGAIYVEVTFSLPGLGTLIIDSVEARDIPVIQGVTLVFSILVVLLNLLIDILYALIDPRIRLDGGTK